MAVIINEFEVIMDNAPEPATPGAKPIPDASPAPALSPLDIADVLRHRAERLARVEAH